MASDPPSSAAAAATPSGQAPLYHMVEEARWRAAKESGAPYYPPTYEQDGFIHLTADPKFLLGIGNHFYKQVADGFLLLVLDPAALTAKVVFEPAAPVGSRPSAGLLKGEGQGQGGEGEAEAEAPLFPHLYGTIDYGAVVSELPIQRDPADGTFLAIPGLAA